MKRSKLTRIRQGKEAAAAAAQAAAAAVSAVSVDCGGYKVVKCKECAPPASRKSICPTTLVSTSLSVFLSLCLSVFLLSVKESPNNKSDSSIFIK